MRAGLLTEIIDILTPTIDTNEFGEEVTDWSVTKSTRARLVHNGGNRSTANSEVFYEYTKTIEIRYYNDINEFQRIRWNGKIYRILDIEPNKEQQMKSIKIQLVDD